ncbi:YhgE/Pip domain-containing protein [Tumebacillus sp. DT12]|uniref:YhgE/Pip domain-containing protein n=1 Tax=Tumebacillus lacus TaxID=2995335 RepID=A0ABT3X141_9BACL|nr:YhgE/Pip domain-containing protein [Tumebacillus lacus]MCX7570631.1 YhgE/Pip domain-containing protein [Tumebacillus lacus]
MNVWWIIRTEFLRLLRSRIGRAALIVGMLIPLLYSGLYLYAFWDPYAQMNEFPVAIVNQDKGAVKDGNAVAYGKEFVEELLAKGDFLWLPISEQEAREGLEDNRYYLIVTIPATFSEDVISVEGEHPRRSQLTFTLNEGKNYIASTISQRLATSVREELGNTFSEEYFKGIFAVIGDAGEGISKAADGANDLADGSKIVADGVRDVNDAAQKLADGSGRIADASQKVATGSAELASGLGRINEGLGTAKTGADQLQSGAAGIASGNEKLAASLQESTAGVKQVRDGLQASAANTDNLKAGLAQMQGTLGTAGSPPQTQDPAQMSALAMLGVIGQKYPDAGRDPLFQGALQKIGGVSGAIGQTAGQVGQSKEGLTQATAALSRIAGGQDQMIAGARQLATGSQSLASGADRLQKGLTDLSAGGAQLTAGAGELATGSQSLADGSRSLSKGNRDLANGTPELLDGSRKVADGNRELADELTKATGEAVVGNSEEKAQIMADPVRVEEVAAHPVGTYGMGFASYFIPLSLWVGAMILYFILSMREYRWVLAPVSTTSYVLGKFFTLGIIGVCQAVISSSVLVHVLGLQVLHLPEFYLFNILFSLTAIAIIGLLIARFGSGAGRFIAIVLLILQLTSSAGTFPIELVPGLFQWLSPFVPMSYAVEGLRSIIATGDQLAVWRDITVLAGVLVTILALHVLTTRRTLRVKDLHAKDELAG